MPKTNPIGPNGRRVAATVAALRHARGMTKTDLSRRMTDVDHPMSLDVITKLEQVRRSLDIDDLFALARALEYPPLLLLFPVGQEPHCEIASGEHRETWTCVQWFNGGRPYSPQPEATDWNDFEKVTSILTRYHQYEDHVAMWFAAVRRERMAPVVARVMGEDQGREEKRRADEEILAAEKLLLQSRMAMMEKGYALPTLPRKEDFPEYSEPLNDLGEPLPYGKDQEDQR